MSRHLVAVLLIGLVGGLSACAHPVDPIVTAGQSMHLAADEFLQTGAMFDKALDLGLITQAQYQPWKLFAEQFKKGWHIAREAWELAASTKNIADRNGAQAALEALLAQLGGFYVEASLLFSHAVDGGSP